MFERQKKSEFIGCKVTPEEYYYISSFASEHEMTISNLIVHSVAEYMARKIVEENEKEDEK